MDRIRSVNTPLALGNTRVEDFSLSWFDVPWSSARASVCFNASGIRAHPLLLLECNPKTQKALMPYTRTYIAQLISFSHCNPLYMHPEAI